MSKYYSNDFKLMIVKLRLKGNSVLKLRQEYNLGKNTVNKWVLHYHRFGNFTDEVQKTREQKEIQNSKKEIARLQMENDIFREILKLTNVGDDFSRKKQ